MTTAFPGSLDTFPSAATLAGHNLDTDPHSTLHGNLGDAIAALQTKVGADASAVSGSIDYKLAHLFPIDNLLINAGGRIDQRGRSGVAQGDDTFALDRWNNLVQTNPATMTTVASDGIQMLQPNATAQRIGLAQMLEQLSIYGMRSKTITLQLEAIASASMTLRIAILEWNGTADAITSDVVNDWTSSTFTPANFFISTINTATVTSVALNTSTYTPVTLTVTLNGSLNNLIVFIWSDATMANGATFTIRSVGLYPGSIARVYAPRAIGLDLMMCQRYYAKSYPFGTAPGTITNTGVIAYICVNSIGGEQSPTVFFPVEMRTSPTFTYYSPGTGASAKQYDVSAAGDMTANGSNTLGPKSASGASGNTPSVNHIYRYHWTAEAEL